MLKTTNKIIIGAMVIMVALSTTIGGCKKESTAPRSTTYQLNAKDQLGVSGTVTFTETASSVTTVEITLSGPFSATAHPAHIHLNSAAEGGSIAISLTDVVNGKSTTTVTQLDNGTAITYSSLIAFDGYVNVHESSGIGLATIIAQGDIGGNVLTGATHSYNLDTTGGYNVKGTIVFAKRNNGNSLATISLTGNLTTTGTLYPANIRLGSVTTVGTTLVTKTLNAVDGPSSKSITNIRTLDDGTAFSYDNILAYDGFVAIEASPTSSTIISKGNIGTH
ncbi:MAG: secreted protein [Bacteroidetes bacterium]|nr:secreted protein [Bacteroidota bacterium]